MKKTIAVLSVVAIGTLSSLSRADSTVVVSPGDLNGWAFHTTNSSASFTPVDTGDPGTSAGLVNGPSSPPLGTGSASFVTGTNYGDDSAQMRLSAFSGTLLSSITELMYSTYATSFNGHQLPWMKLYLSNGDALVFEPTYSTAGAQAPGVNPSPQAAVAANTWQTWDALDGMWYSDNGLGGATAGSGAVTWSTILAIEAAAGPDPVTLAPDSSQGGVIRFTSGQSQPSDHYDTNVDAFTIGVSGVNTTYDFEAVDPVSTPLPGSLGMGMIMLSGFAVAFTAWKRRQNVAVRV